MPFNGGRITAISDRSEASALMSVISHAATYQHKVTGAPRNQPLCRLQAESAQTAGYEVAGIRGQLQPALFLPRSVHGIHAALVGHDDFADVTGLLHVTEGVHDFLRFEAAIGKRVQDSFLEERQHLAVKPGGEIRALLHQRICVDAEVADVVAEGAQAYLRVLLEIPLAEFQESPKGLEYSEVSVDGLACQRVQDHIDSAAFSDRHDFVGKGERSRVEDMVHAQQAQEVAFLRGTCGGEDFGSLPLRDLYRCNSHAAGGAVDQDLLAFLDARKVIQGVIDRKEGARDGGCSFESQSGRNRRDAVSLGHDEIAETAWPEAEDPVTGSEVPDPTAHGCHDPCELQTQCGSGKAVFDRPVGQETEGVHDVTEIQAGGLHLDFKLIMGGRHMGARLPPQVAQLSGKLEPEAQDRRFEGCGCRRLICRGCLDLQAHHVPIAGSGQHDLLLGVRVRNLSRQTVGKRIQRSLIINVHEPY
jgi:hypothetical protein